jgi:hypothetical protein
MSPILFRMADISQDVLLAALLGTVVGGVVTAVVAYIALRRHTVTAERARMSTEIMYHVMTAVILLEEGLAATEEILYTREKGAGKKEVNDLANKLRKQLERGFAGYDPLRPHLDYRVGKLFRLPGPAMKMLDELEKRLMEAFRHWDGGRLLNAAAKGDDKRVLEFDALVTRSAEDVKRFAKVLQKV